MCGRGNCDGSCLTAADDEPRCAKCGDYVTGLNAESICERCVELAEEADAMPFDEAWPTRPTGV